MFYDHETLISNGALSEAAGDNRGNIELDAFAGVNLAVAPEKTPLMRAYNFSGVDPAVQRQANSESIKPA